MTTSCYAWHPNAVARRDQRSRRGDMTFYWTNQQGGRLMFYHDHAYGITRLNVYAGEAAGYLLYDPAEEAALNAAAGTLPPRYSPRDLAHLIPLVIQDKTFVPSAAQLDDGSNLGGLRHGCPEPATLATSGSRTSTCRTRTRTTRWAARAIWPLGLRCVVLPADDDPHGWRQRCGDHPLHVCRFPVNCWNRLPRTTTWRLPDHSQSVRHAGIIHGHAASSTARRIRFSTSRPRLTASRF